MGTLVYDGDCAFCTRWARWAEARGATVVPRQEAPLDPDLAKAAKKSVLWLDDEVLDRSAACVRTLWSMRRGWPLAGGALWLVPKPLRDWGYGFAARRWGPL